MEQGTFEGIVFTDDIGDCGRMNFSGRIIHVLCRKGGMSFSLQDVRYNVLVGDYVILPSGAQVSGFSAAEGFEGIIMGLSEEYVASIAIRSNYGIIGHLSLLQNPVMRLSSRDFRLCENALLNLRERMEDVSHLFRNELLGSLLTAHILDLYDIHARSHGAMEVPERAAVLLRQFIALLYEGQYVRHRDIGFYASRLCISPHYLSELCRKVSGQPATYWIDRFTLHEITRLLRQKDLQFTEIAEHMNFSSVSYFSRYVKQKTGLSPSGYRSRSLSGQ